MSSGESSSASEVQRAKKINFKLLKNIDNTQATAKSTAEEAKQLNQIIAFRSANASSYHLTRIVLIRFIGFIYGI